MSDSVLLEIDAKILRHLLESYGLKISDFRCSDQKSKEKIRDLYLEITQNNLYLGSSF